MSAEITVTDLATPELRRIARIVARPRLLLQACGKRVEGVLHKHFLRRDAEGNAKGWVRSHFWNREVKRSTAYQGATDSEATVSIASRQFAQRLYGGTIRAKGGRFLALPLTNQAKAKGSPGEWTAKGDGKLEFFKSKSGGRFLFPGKGQSHRASYVLVKSVTQKPDPRALPRRTDIQTAIDDEGGKFLARQLARK